LWLKSAHVSSMFCKKGADMLDQNCTNLRTISAIIVHSNESPNEVTVQPAQVDVVRREAHTDEQLIELWLHGRSRHTQRAYRSDAERFLGECGKDLGQVTLSDLQRFADQLEKSELYPASRHRRLSAIKSLMAFGLRIGYLSFDVARPLKLPGIRERLSERILDEGAVQRMIAHEPHPRNRAMLLLLYAAGLRVSELCGLTWNDLEKRIDGGQISVFGKGEKTRAILLPPAVWAVIASLRDDAPNTAPVFSSRKVGHLDPSQVWRIVRRAAERAEIDKDVSCHWLRHAHASHALDRGAPISLVQATLGHASIATTGRYLHARPSDSSANYLSL